MILLFRLIIYIINYVFITCSFSAFSIGLLFTHTVALVNTLSSSVENVYSLNTMDVSNIESGDAVLCSMTHSARSAHM